MNRADLVGQIAIVLIESGVTMYTSRIDDMCEAIPCGTTDCDTCPFDSIHNFNQFKKDYQDA